MKILIADDDKEIVELLSIYVHNEGYEAVRLMMGKKHYLKSEQSLILNYLF